MADVDGRDTFNGDLGDQDNICRDFLRNVCHRGMRCKYRHPDGNEAKGPSSQINFIFCHDYQNTECRRPNCKFIHCDRSDEDYYHATGELPTNVAGVMGLNNNDNGNSSQNVVMDKNVPVCMDYFNGVCRRGRRCKYRHISPADYDVEMGGSRGDSFPTYNPGFDSFEGYEPERKRRMFEDFGNGSMAPSRGILPHPQPPPPTDYYSLQEENGFLRRKLDELRKQVADLTATNGFLLEQNAQLRLGKPGSVPPVAQSMNPNPMAGPPTPHSMAQMSQQMPMSGDMAQELAAAPQSIAPIVPVSLSAPVMAPVSLAQAIPAVSLVQSLPQSPLVSYPIMTQSMRSAIPQSNLTR